MKKILGSLTTLILIAGAGIAQAQDSAPPPDSASQGSQLEVKLDPGVARVSFVQGEVSTQRGDNGEWVAVTVNSPVSADDRVSTGDNSRAELQLDSMNILRMSERATARIANITRSQIQVQVGQGLVTYNVLRGSEAAAEIDTPNASIRPQVGEGEYRIMVTSDAETKVIVRRGSAEISTSSGSTPVEQGQMITIAGTDNPQYQATRAPDRDEWDGWNSDRNHRVRTAGSWGKTNRYYTGAEDLDNHGVWTEVPDYGPVWTPRVEPGWAPYRAGRWVWEPYYGWTWVSYEPWGWAPYHYGRWFVYGGNWVWWPGPVVGFPGYYPVWAPAYVSFFGFGGSVGFGFGFGSVGWLALGPGDWCHPWWGRWGGERRDFRFRDFDHDRGRFDHDGFRPLGENRRRQFSNLSEASRDARVRGGVSTMAGNQFGRGAVPTHQAGVSASSLRESSILSGKSPMTPGRGSYNATDRGPGASSVRSSTARSQRFFTPNQANTRTNTSARAATSGGRPTGALSGGRTTTSGPTGSTGSRSTGSAPSSANASRGNASRGKYSGPTARGNSTPSGQALGQTGQSGQSSTGGSWQHHTPPASSQSRGAVPSTQPRTNQSPYGQPGHSQAPNNQSPYGRSPSTQSPNGRAPSGPSTYGRAPSGQSPSGRAPSAGQSPYGRSPYGQSPNSSRGNTSRAYNRPPLNMNRPIVTPRGGSAGAGNRGGSTGGNRGGAPSGGSRGSSGSSGGSSHPSAGSSHGSGGGKSGGRH